MELSAIIIEILLGLIFLMAGSMKVFGSKMQVESFEHLKLPQWFRVVTGLMQFVGVIAIAIGIWEPSWAAGAGIWFGFMMLCATAAHVRVKDSVAQSVPALILMILSIAVTLLHSSELMNFLG